MATSGQIIYEQRDPSGNEMRPLAQRLLLAPLDWQQALSICLADETTERLLLVAPAGDAFIAIYFEGQDQPSRQIEKIVSNGHSAALLMLMRLVQQFNA